PGTDMTVAMPGGGQVLDNSCRVAGDKDARWDIVGHHGVRSNNRTFADRDPFEDQGPGPDPDVVAQGDRLRTLGGRRQPGQPGCRVDRMPVGVEETDPRGQQTVPA